MVYLKAGSIPSETDYDIIDGTQRTRRSIVSGECVSPGKWYISHY